MGVGADDGAKSAPAPVEIDGPEALATQSPLAAYVPAGAAVPEAEPRLDIIDNIAEQPALGPLLEKALAQIRKNEIARSVNSSEVATPLLEAKMGVISTPERRS